MQRFIAASKAASEQDYAARHKRHSKQDSLQHRSESKKDPTVPATADPSPSWVLRHEDAPPRNEPAAPDAAAHRSEVAAASCDTHQKPPDSSTDGQQVRL